VEEDVVVVLENEEEVRGRVQVRLYGTPRDRVVDAYGSHVIIFIVFLLSIKLPLLTPLLVPLFSPLCCF